MKAAEVARPRYKNVPERKAEGATYTPENLANFVARQIVLQLPPVPLKSRLKVLDPAIGEAALLISLLRQLKERGIEEVDVYGFDTDRKALQTASNRLRFLFPRAQLHFAPENFLRFVDRTSNRGDLFADRPSVKFDLIIANPPYVRTQILGADLTRKMAQRYGLTGRIDLYYAFILAIGEVLSDDGVAGVIVSNRFMTTKSGNSVRKSLLRSFQIDRLWDLGDTKLFEAAVLPAILLFGRRQANSHASPPPHLPAFMKLREMVHHRCWCGTQSPHWNIRGRFPCKTAVVFTFATAD